MRILLVGASGFIGRHLLSALSGAGHQVLATSRAGIGPSLPGVQWLALDLLQLDGFSWPGEVDVLIHATGELSTDRQSMVRLQGEASCRLFDLAARQGARVLQLSALGAGDQPEVPFLASKAVADQYLLALGIPALVLRPSLVLGEGGASSRWLQRLSPWPLIPLLDNQARLQPLHVADLCATVLALLRDWPATSQIVPLVGPEVITAGELIDRLRHAQGWSAGRYAVLPAGLTALLVTVGERFNWPALNRQSLQLARSDNLASAEPLAGLCGYRCAPLSARLQGWPTAEQTASLALQPLLLAVLLFIWLGTALVCMGPGYAWGLQIMAELGVSGRVAQIAVLAGAGLDALLGLGLLWRRLRGWVLKAQMAVILGYSLVISVCLPHYWADPFMAVGKNVAVLLLCLWLLWLTPASDKDMR